MSFQDFIARHEATLTAQTVREHGICGYVSSGEFKTDRISWCIRYEIFLQAMNDFLRAFPEATPIKGMSLIPRIYKNPALREVTDIDLYYPYDPEPVVSYLRREGFEIDHDKWEGNDYKLNARKKILGIDVPFEIHKKLLWTKDEPWQIGQEDGNRTLAPEDELVYLSGHLVYQHSLLSLHWLIDIALLIQDTKDWDENRLNNLLSRLPLKNSLSTALWCVREHFKQDLGVVLNRFILTDIKNKMIQQLITEDFLWLTMHAKGRYYLLKHLFKDTFAEALKYDVLWIKNVLQGKREEP